MAGQVIRGNRRAKRGEVIGSSNLTGDLGSGTPVGVAPDPIQNTPEVLAKRPDRRPVLRERVAVSNPDDHRPNCPSVLARWRKHRGCEPIAFLVAEGEEHGHDPLNVRLEPDVPLDVGAGWRDIAHPRVFTRLSEMLLDRMAHQIGFQGRFSLGLDQEPSLPIRGVAHVSHDPAHLCGSTAVSLARPRSPENALFTFDLGAHHDLHITIWWAPRAVRGSLPDFVDSAW